jgi:hypothetical protein
LNFIEIGRNNMSLEVANLQGLLSGEIITTTVQCGIMKTCNRFLKNGLDDQGSRVQFPARAGNFSLHHRVQNGSGVHPASYPMGTRGCFPGDKAAGA